jgi:hypothetical protein
MEILTKSKQLLTLGSTLDPPNAATSPSCFGIYVESINDMRIKTKYIQQSLVEIKLTNVVDQQHLECHYLLMDMPPRKIYLIKISTAYVYM